VGPFPHGFGQTTPRTALPALGSRRPGGWMCSRVGHSLHPLDGTPCRHNGQRFRVGPFPHGFGQTTPRTALPALGSRRPGGWMCSRVGHSLHPLDGTPCRHNGQRFRVARFSMGFGRRRRERLGVAIMFLNLAHFAPAAGPSRTKSSSPSSPLRTFSMDAEKGNPLLGGAPWGFLPSRPGRLAGHSSGPWRAPSSERLPCLWPAWRLAPPRRRRRVSPPLTALLAQALSCSRSCHSCADAVAQLLLQPSPPSRSPCRHVAVA
jgi:hypothetical protein